MNNEWKEMKEIGVDGEAFIQVRRSAGENFMHIQAYGESLDNGNREYGYADKFTVPPVVADAIAELHDNSHQHKLFPSLTSDTSPMYYRGLLSVHAYADGVQLHVAVPHGENNSEGMFITDLPAQRFGKLIAFLDDNGLLINHEGEQRFVASLQEDE